MPDPLYPDDAADPQAQPETGDAPRPARRLDPRLLGWGAFALVVVALIGWLVAPAALRQGRLAPPGPEAWEADANNAMARAMAPPPAAVAPKPKPKPADEEKAAEAEIDTLQIAPAANDQAPATAPAADQADDDDDAPPADDGVDAGAVRRAIARARGKALERGDPVQWQADGLSGYVVVSSAETAGARTCRNVAASVIQDGKQPQSSTERWCRDGDDGDWKRR